MWELTSDGLNFSSATEDELQFCAIESLKEEGFLRQDLMPWDSLYKLLQSKEWQGIVSTLHLPTVDETIFMRLTSHNALSDDDFFIEIALERKVSINTATRCGAFLDGKILPENLWRIFELNKAFFQERKQTPGLKTNRKYWGLIRGESQKGHIRLDHFLTHTHVITPQKVNIVIDQSALQDTTKELVSVDIAGLPSGWKRAYESGSDVKDHYSIPQSDGSLVHVVIEEPVRKVLRKIRQVSEYGADKDELLAVAMDPWTHLGDRDKKIIQGPEEPETFFVLYDPLIVVHTANGLISSLTLHLEPIGHANEKAISAKIFHSEDWRKFIARCHKAYEKGNQVINWSGYAISLSHVSKEQFDQFNSLCTEWEKQEISNLADKVLDLSQYGDRVIGFGEYIARKIPDLLAPERNRWLSEELENTELGDLLPFAKLLDSYDYPELDDLATKLEIAKSTNDDIQLPKSTQTVPYEIAQRLYEKLRVYLTHKYQEQKDTPCKKKPKKTGLVTEQNTENTAVATAIQELNNTEAYPKLPCCLKANVRLKPHQLKGVAWLQSLYKKSQKDHHIKGCLLADDMGLGKTLQLLTFIFHLFEDDPKAPPALVIAPVALLLNWQDEIDKFFDTDIEVMTLYGAGVKSLALDKATVRAAKLQSYRPQLKENWVGEAKIILTTYETLRTYQMPLARTRFSVIVCDEAQKIKNPNTIVHCAANALQGKFRIACTGTPVENSLVDLWSMFDFCCPLWLPGASRFSRMYGNCTKEDLSQLHQQIDPLTLHRMKKDWIDDLPVKVEDTECQHLPMNTYQYDIYTRLIANFQQQTDKHAILGLLHQLKLACAHPDIATGNIQNGCIVEHSPKMEWLLKTIRSIRAKNEKVIIFTEIRDLQFILRGVLRKHFGIDAPVVNGSVAVRANSVDSDMTREGIIRHFRKTEGFAVIILSGLAVGFGVNIQEANHVIHFTRHWNPAKEDQATDRVYRIGQQKTVHVYYPTVCVPFNDPCGIHTSFDEVLNRLLNDKRKTAHDILQGLGKDLVNEVVDELRHSPPSGQISV